jgi:hypothetical protein
MHDLAREAASGELMSITQPGRSTTLRIREVVMSSTLKRISAALEGLHKLYPRWRFGQLVANVATWAKGPDAQAVWDVEDESFLRAAEEHLQSNSRGAGTSDKVKKAG